MKIVRTIAATVSWAVLGTTEEEVAHEGDPAPLPGCAVQDPLDGLPQSLVGIRDHQPDALQAPLHQDPQEGEPELVILARAGGRA
jgi:hypothetical protein